MTFLVLRTLIRVGPIDLLTHVITFLLGHEVVGGGVVVCLADQVDWVDGADANGEVGFVLLYERPHVKEIVLLRHQVGTGVPFVHLLRVLGGDAENAEVAGVLPTKAFSICQKSLLCSRKSVRCSGRVRNGNSEVEVLGFHFLAWFVEIAVCVIGIGVTANYFWKDTRGRCCH